MCMPYVAPPSRRISADVAHATRLARLGLPIPVDVMARLDDGGFDVSQFDNQAGHPHPETELGDHA